MPVRTRTFLLASLLLHAAGAPLGAQGEPQRLGGREMAGTAALNGMVGGTTAAIRAASGGRDPRRAFLLGFAGGAGYGAGKILASRGHVATAAAGILVAGTGSSVVANAGRGIGWADEIALPVGPVRARVHRAGPRRLSLSVNAYEVALVVRSLARPGLRVDWGRSAAAGTAVFVTEDRHIISRGDTALGVATGSVIAIGSFAPDPSLVLRHEIAHVHQHWFMQQNWGQPIEAAVRRRTGADRWIPAWLDLGVAVPLLRAADEQLFGHPSTWYRVIESEADVLGRR